MPDNNRSTTQGNLFFEARVDSYVVKNPRFVRRDWLADEVAERLKTPQSRFILLMAAPNTGKSSIAARPAQMSLGPATPDTPMNLCKGREPFTVLSIPREERGTIYRG